MQIDIILCSLIVILSSGAILVTAQDPSDPSIYVFVSTPDVVRLRNSKRTTGTNEIVICDSEVIQDDQWVRFDANNTLGPGCHMPEHCVAGPRCGANNPIWMDGKHPSSSDPGPVTVFSCISASETACCVQRDPMQVKWCSPGFFVYKVKKPPSCYIAFCCDAPPNAGPSLITPQPPEPVISSYSPINQFYPINNGPELAAILNATLFSVKCYVEFQSNAQVESADYGPPVVKVYLVAPLANQSYISLISEPFTQTTLENKTYLISEDKLYEYLDKPLSCRIVSSWDRWPTVTTDRYGLGTSLQVSPWFTDGTSFGEDVILTEKDQFSIYMKPNFPVTSPYCFSRSHQISGTTNAVICYYTFSMKVNNGNQGAQTGSCFIRFYTDLTNQDFKDGSTPTTTMFVSVGKKTIGTRETDIITTIEFQPLSTPNQIASIFFNYELPKITIIVSDNTTRPRCVVSGYLRIEGFQHTSVTKLAVTAGDYYMLRLNESAKETLEIQIRIQKCHDYQTALCVAGLYAREVQYQTVLNDSYGDLIPKPSIVNAAENQWRIILLSELTITVNLANGNLKVDILAYDSPAYSGLCTEENSENFAAHSVPKEKSLFCNIAECVNQVVPQRSCDCEGDLTYVPNINVTCKREYDINTALTFDIIGSQICKKNVKVLSPGSEIVTEKATKDNSTILVHPPVVFPPPEICGTVESPTGAANVIWPTPYSHITEMQAEDQCNKVLQSSPVYTKCQGYVQIDDLINQCKLDIQITEDLSTANSYLSKFNDDCVYDLETRIVLDKNGYDITNNQPALDGIKKLLCPNNCTYNGEQRGNCTDGICHCMRGYHGLGCSFKEGSPPVKIKPVRDAVNYTVNNMSTLILLAADNVEPDNITARRCRYTLTSPYTSDPSTYAYVRAQLMTGGVVACLLPDVLVKSKYIVKISLTNDGLSYSSETSVLLYDGTCLNCTNQTSCVQLEWTEIKNGECTRNTNPCKWIDYDNYHSWNGVLQSGVNTIEECMRRCCNSSNCVALDFDSKPNSIGCWFHTDVLQVDGSRRSNQGVMQKVKVECRTCITKSWTLYPNKNSFGATLYDQFHTADTCKSFCECKENCLGLDFDRVQNSCWIHTSSDAISAKYDNSAVDQYAISCQRPTPPCMKWDILNKTQSVGAQFYENLQTLASCLKHCQELPDCVVADINSGSSTIWCWLHLSKQQADSTRRAASGVDQYVLRRCPSGSCASLWLPYPGYQSYNGKQIAGVNTAESCKARCEGLKDCVAVDFDLSSNSCWWQNDPNAVANNRGGNSQVNQFYFLRSFASCQIDWKVNSGVQSAGATRDNSVSSLDDCKNKCAADLTCVALDFNRATTPQECWIYRDINQLVNKYTNSNIDQYVIIRP